MGVNGRRVRVLFWSEQFWPTIGGIEVWSANLLPALRERGYEIIVVTSHGSLDLPDTAQYKGIPIFRFPFWKALLDRNIDQLMELKRQVARLKRSFEPHLVHFNLTGPSVYFHVETAHAHGAPLLVSLHQPLHRQNQTGCPHTLVGHALRSADWVSAGSLAVLQEARLLAPEITARSSLIYYGLDAPALAPEPLPVNAPRLLCLGRLVPEKGFDLALTAFAAISDRFPHVRLTIASGGPARPALERQATDLGLTDRVDFVDWIEFDRIPSLMNSASMVLMPSRSLEGFGLVALEAALMARPVVGTRCGGLPEVVIDGTTGLLVAIDDSSALADAIAYLLTHPDLATEMGKAARSRAQDLFGLKRHIDAFDSLYRRLIERITLQAVHTQPHINSAAEPS